MLGAKLLKANGKIAGSKVVQMKEIKMRKMETPTPSPGHCNYKSIFIRIHTKQKSFDFGMS